jgi:hypothetical protein
MVVDIPIHIIIFIMYHIIKVIVIPTLIATQVMKLIDLIPIEDTIVEGYSMRGSLSPIGVNG